MLVILLWSSFEDIC